MISMTAALFRAELFREVGPLSESFDSYLEDVDFGIRCGAKGYTGHYVPHAIASHKGSATYGRWNPRTVRLLSRNQVYLVARHYSTPQIIRNGWSIALGQGCGD
jgi:GT2 family glycosyltransferase